MPKGKTIPKMTKTSKTQAKTAPTKPNKTFWVVLLVLGTLLVVALIVIVVLLLNFNKATSDAFGVDGDNASSNVVKDDTSKTESSKDGYDKNHPVIMITDRNTPVLTSEKDGHLVQTAEVNMYCDLQDGYEISRTSGKAYKGEKPISSHMDYENSQNYHKYSQYGSVALICTGHGSYQKSDQWELGQHYLKIDFDNITDDGHFTFTEEAWLNPDGSTKEFRDFASDAKLIRILSTAEDADTRILEDYQVKMHFVLNRGAQEFLTNWQKTINTL